MKLSRKSNLLINFFLNNHFSMRKLTPKTKNIFKILFYDITNAYEFLIKTKKTNFSCDIKKIKNYSDIAMPKKFNSSSFPEVIRKQIELNSEYELMFKFKILNRNIKIYFIIESEINNSIRKQIFEYIDLILMWLFIVNEYSTLNCSKELTIFIYLTQLGKQLPRSNLDILNPIHVNTAFTTSCPYNSEIVIFRSEEWFKVFIHETFHNFGLDFSTMNTSFCNKEILDIFRVESEVNLYEAYAEFWAQIINVCFCSFLFLIDKANINEYLTNIEMFINLEIQFGLFQLVKVLNFMGLKYKDLYSNDPFSSQQRNNLYKEKTNVLAYFVIKSVLMNNFQGFLDWCHNNNLSLLNFKKTDKNIKKFCKFIKDNYKSKIMCKNIKNAELFFEKKKFSNLNNGIYCNLRMSILDF